MSARAQLSLGSAISPTAPPREQSRCDLYMTNLAALLDLPNCSPDLPHVKFPRGLPHCKTRHNAPHYAFRQPHEEFPYLHPSSIRHFAPWKAAHYGPGPAAVLSNAPHVQFSISLMHSSMPHVEFGLDASIARTMLANASRLVRLCFLLRIWNLRQTFCKQRLCLKLKAGPRLTIVCKLGRRFSNR